MFISVGEKLYGVVDRVPGHFYIATPFLHFCEFPIFPGRSYLVIEGTQVDPTLFRKGSFAGYSIHWSLKSIAMAWFRAFLGLLALAGFITALGTYLAYFNDKKHPGYLHVALSATAAIVLCLGLYLLSRRLEIASSRRVIALARRLEGKYPKASVIVQTYLEESGLHSPSAQNGQDEDPRVSRPE